MRSIKELLILTESGTNIFCSNKDEEESSQVLSMLLSAMNSFAHELGKTELTSLEFKDDKYSVLKKRGLLFVVKSKKKAKSKLISRELEYISEFFFERYGEEFFKYFDGDIECCTGLEKDLEHFMPKQLKKIIEGLGWA